MSPRTRKLSSDHSSGVATLEPPTVPSYSEVIRKRIRADLTAYRAMVARVVGGEQLGEDEILTAYETLHRLGFNPGQLEADVSAIGEHKRNREKWEAAVAREPAERARGKEIAAEIDTLKKRIGELQLEARRLQGLKAVGYLQRCNQLADQFAHVVDADLDRAVETRARALKVDAVSGAAT